MMPAADRSTREEPDPGIEGLGPPERTAVQPGVLAVSPRRVGRPLVSEVRSVLKRDGIADATLHQTPGLVVATWGGLRLQNDGVLLLSRGPRRRDRDLPAAEVARLLATGDAAALAQALPPFAAIRRAGGEAVAVTDALGFRHLYRAEQDGWAGFSTSARLLALVGACPIDLDSLTLQSLLGWQVGQATLHQGVTKLSPGEMVILSEGRLRVSGSPPAPPATIGLDDAVDAAARMLRANLAAYLTDHPDATLQLTGGQDSRILLSAVPEELRVGLRAVTLRVPGSPDAEIARDLAGRTGLRHHVGELENLVRLDPAEALRMCVEGSRRLEGMADPVAHVGLALAERHFDQGHRIAGLGGEVARGFYYIGRARETAVTRARVERLTTWRMFANEAIDPAALSAELREGLRERAVDRILGLMLSTGQDWLRATDEFYLYQRMQRWAGVTDTAVCLDRSVVNPMLDDRFIDIARALSPRDKHGSQFLARLQMALDPALGRLPLDHRPSPEAYARRGMANRARAANTLARKAASKVRQRVSHATRPPAGGVILAAKVVDQWRRDPGWLHGAAMQGVLDQKWLDDVLASRVEPAPSTVAFVLNVGSLPAPP